MRTKPAMSHAEYIKVIVPVRLDRILTYRVPAGMQGRVGIGSRVKVRLGSRTTDAVVCETGVDPELAPERIHAIEGLDEGLERISPEEIRLWRFIAGYYFCTVGEVFKCAYPSGKIRSEETAARVRERADASRRKLLEAARLRVAKLEAEIEAVHTRTEEALSKLGERAVKTRERLSANRDARLARLQEALHAAHAAVENLASSGGPGLRDAGPDRARETTGGRASNRPETGQDGILLRQALSDGKPVLLQGSSAARHGCYRTLIADTLAQGRSALLLVPEIALTETFEADMKERFGSCAQVFHSRETTVFRRKMADILRTEGPHLLIGTRSALFLPFHALSLIIVDEEQDRSYKQDSPAPRYNARDCAVVLAGIHGAHVLLGSGAPSLESLYNCSIGRYTGITLNREGLAAIPDGDRFKLIDTAAERRKNGMKGQFSIKLLDEIRYTLDQGAPVYLIRLWGDLQATVEEAAALFPGVAVRQIDETQEGAGQGGILIGTLSRTKRLTFAEGSLVAILQADPILGAQDFRADERAFQLFDRYREHCAAGTFLIQTSRSAHPAFLDLLEGRQPWTGLLEERKAFGYPPYSRIIDLDFSDPNPKRLALMSQALAGELARAVPASAGRVEGPFETGEGRRSLRVILNKDRRFPEWKQKLKKTVDSFVRDRKYNGFIHWDVDPE